MLFDESKFKTKKELFKFMIKNHDALISLKKSEMKKAEACSFLGINNYTLKGDSVYKANEIITEPGNKINVLAVINSTNWLDKHMDVHIPGLWKKSLQENKFIKHLQEHRMAFDKIISDKSDLKSFTKKLTWKELGFNFTGKSECLIFDSIVKRSRNEFMFDQYANGHVDNHSVGMRYIKISMCINDESSGAYFDAWEKYYDQIINPEIADKKGFFWAVPEAMVVEGSAVPIGSNIVTPTLENNKTEKELQLLNIEPLIKALEKDAEPVNSTLNINNLINNF